MPPISLNENSPNKSDNNEQLKFLFQSTPIFSFQVKRNDILAENIWDTSIGKYFFN